MGVGNTGPYLLGACAGDGEENERCDRERGLWEEQGLGDVREEHRRHTQTNLGEDFLFPLSRDQRDSVQSAPNQGANGTCWTRGKTGRRDLPCRLWWGGCVYLPYYMNLFLSFLT